MMNQKVKRRIDNARQVLVGKVPDPKSQVEQITTALIYKFMDDMDKESERLGGKPGFFVNGYEEYSWTKLMDSRVGGQDRLNLYAEAIDKLSQNPHLPQLFRDIFKGAFLPYRDPETLNLFLKEIDSFSYSSTDNLGDAYEYLLSVLGSQGDAGQFRTPRHIINFIVSIVDPKKTETVLDPACGTAGFLILAYLHILNANAEKKPGDMLSPDEKEKLIHNFVGYDIDPAMKRLSLVNMYLHHFPAPHIYEYDTLTYEEKWQEQFDVIMANPPFMSPKGGIRPHKRFAIQAKRSEVLFVDYIAEHLNINGRAGVIVPEGIIFRSANAYKSLRKMLVDDYLWAVVSFPAGVFQPYSGVKTSILFMDKKLARQTDKILFVKVESDGFDLGAQRREIDKSDLPFATDVMNFYKNNIRKNKSLELPEEYLKIANIVPKQKIIDSGDYNLSGDRYKEVVNFANQKWPMVKLGDVCAYFNDGDWIESKDQAKTGFRLIQTGNVGVGEYLDKADKARFITEETFNRLKCKEIFPGDILISRLPDPVGRSCMVPKLNTRMVTAVDCTVARANKNLVDLLYLLFATNSETYFDNLSKFLTGASRKRISRKNLEVVKIPLPPLEAQKQIAQEIEGYQKIIDGARQVVENWKPTIKVDPKWPMVELGKVSEFINGLWKGKRPPFKKIKVIRNTNFSKGGELNLDDVAELDVEVSQFEKRALQKGDIILEKSGGGPTQPVGRVVLFNLDEDNYSFSNFTSLIRIKDKTKLFPFFLWAYLNNLYQGGYTENLQKRTSGIRNLDFTAYKSIEIPLPPLEVQKQIVSQIAEEQKAVDACKKLIEINEQKIKSKISEVWRE